MNAKWSFLGLGVVLLFGACTRPAEDSPPTPEDPSSTTPEIFSDITEDSGVSFVHVSDPLGNFWLPEQIG